MNTSLTDLIMVPVLPQATQAAVAPILHLRTVNPYLHSALHSPTGSLLTQVPRTTLPWSNQTPQGCLVGGVSSFAFMGTNGHALVAGPLTKAGADAAASAGEGRVEQIGEGVLGTVLDPCMVLC